MRNGLLALVVAVAVAIVALQLFFDEAPGEVAAIETRVADSEPDVTDEEVALLQPPHRPVAESERVEVTPELAKQLAIERMTKLELEGWIVELEADLASLRGELDAQADQAVLREVANAPHWSAAKVVGPPDADPSHDDPRAWASASPDTGLEWLELRFKPPMRAHTLRVYEVHSAGAVVRVTALDEQGGNHILWSGVDPTPAPGVFEIAFGLTSYRIQSVKITLDTTLHPGWNEVDAVELVGPEGRAWVYSAKASSHFGQALGPRSLLAPK